MSTRGSVIPDLMLERYLLRELPPAGMDAVRQAVERDVQVRARLAALEESNRQILARYPAPWVATRVQERGGTAPARPPRRRAARWALSLATAAAVAVVAVPVLRSWRGAAEDEGTRLKGEQLLLFRKTPAGSEALPDSSLARQGDVLQIVYRGAGERYGAILSVDGRGTITWHLPASGPQSAALRTSGADTLGFAYELDDAPRWERFYLVSAPQPFALRVLQQALERLPAGGGPLSLPPGFRQHVVTLRKVEGDG